MKKKGLKKYLERHYWCTKCGIFHRKNTRIGKLHSGHGAGTIIRG